MSPSSSMGTSQPVTPGTPWAPQWSSAVTLATHWNRAPPSLSASIPVTHSGTRRSRHAAVGAGAGVLKGLELGVHRVLGLRGTVGA